MRRINQVMTTEEVTDILKNCTHGVLACLGDQAYPYAVPLNYVYNNETIYFHSAKVGHKIDALTNHSKVSFAVIDDDTIISEEYTSYFRSAIVFGQARFVKDAEWRTAFQALVEKYSGDRPDHEKKQQVDSCDRSAIIAIDVEHITGKMAKEYVK
jgi:hypothetical protein